MKKKGNKVTYVLHDIDTSDEHAPNGESWISYWEETTKHDKPQICPCCKQKVTEDNPIVGAHVTKWLDMTNPSREQYIVPTCDKCNKTYKGINHLKGFSVPSEWLAEIIS